jgi:hypothetical protein
MQPNQRKTKNTRLRGPIPKQLQRVCHDILDFIQVPGFPSAIRVFALTHSRRIVFNDAPWLISFSLDVMRSREAAGCDWASLPHLLDTAFVAGTMGKKAAWQQANPFHNISNDRGGACG